MAIRRLTRHGGAATKARVKFPFKKETLFEVSSSRFLHLLPLWIIFVRSSEQSMAFAFVATGSAFRRQFHPQMTQIKDNVIIL